MECNKDFRFEVSISKDAYKSKEETNAATASGDEGKARRKALGLTNKICFKEQAVNAEQLLEQILEGHTFCYLFGGFPPNTDEKTYVRKDGYFTMSGKADRFFKGTYIVGVDIDDTTYESAEEFISKLSLQPTFWYTTLSNKQKDKNKDGILDARFRMMFVFDRIIGDKYFFRYVSSVIHHLIEKDTQEKITDPCGKSCSQYFNGTYYDAPNLIVDFDITNQIYSLSDFNITTNGYLDFLNKNCEYKDQSLTPLIKKDIQFRRCALLSKSNVYITNTPTTLPLHPSALDKSAHQKQNSTVVEFDMRLITSYYNFSFDEFRKRNSHYHHYVYRTERVDGWEYFKDIKYQRCNEDYIELLWICEKIPIGGHRPTIILQRAVLRRIMEPSMTPTDLLYNLILDREWNFVNTDDKLSLQKLKDIVKVCFTYNIEELKVAYKDVIDFTREKCCKKKFIIHWTCQGKIKANSLAKEMRWEFLDSIYDRTKSVDENLQIFKDSSLDVELDVGLTRSTLYNYCRSRSIYVRETKKEERMRKFKQLHNDYMSLREEVEFLKANGLPISMTTLRNYIKRLKEEQAA